VHGHKSTSWKLCVLYYMYMKLSPFSSLATLVLNETHYCLSIIEG